MAGNWIGNATAHAHGQFKAKAGAAGLTTAEAAKKWAHKPGRTGQQARLAKTLMGLNKK